jgi:uncharacterized protein YecE (DUF72 family)
MTARIRVGTAGWAIPARVAPEFPGDGSVLARYANVLNAVEINSTFYRPHQPKTFERWAATVPATFNFAVKTPRAVTHTARLRDSTETVEAFLDQISHLGPTLGPLLLQLPPSFAFDPQTVGPFCRVLGQDGRFRIVCEPRHVSWFTPEVDRWLAKRRIARVAADPARSPGAGEPGGWRGLSYYRMHGSPQMYYSAYRPGAVTSLQDHLERDSAGETWCIFDNTASGAALPNALALYKGITER